MLTLENQTLRLGIDEATGSLVSLLDRATGWDYTAPNPHNAPFQLLIPLEDAFPDAGEYHSRRNNLCTGGSRPPRLTRTDDGLTMVWDSVVSPYGGVHDIRVTACIRLDDRSAVFSMTLENHSGHTIESACYPYLAPLRIPREDGAFRLSTRGYAQLDGNELYPRFDNTRGYYGVSYPTVLRGSNPQTPYALLHSEKRGLAVMTAGKGMDPLFFQSQLHPGWGDSMHAAWPAADAIGGQEVYCDFAPAQLPFAADGETFTLLPLLFEPFVGDWTYGLDVYKRVRSTCMQRRTPPSWLEQPHAWLQYQMNSPEDELRLCYSELPRLAADCKRHGIRAIQLVGWNDGGQDQGNPSHAHDPRLGTYAELRTAIEECQRMGVQIILFSKFNWADMATGESRQSLHRLSVKDPFGLPYQHPGYQYQTLPQLSGVRVKRFYPLCFNSAETLSVCRTEFSKLLDSGAAGTLYDECFHRAPTWLCFDPTHGHRVPAPSQGMDVAFPDEMIPADRADDFLMAGEALYDRMFERYHLSYIRTEDPRLIPSDRYVADDCRIMTAVTGFDDRNMLNQCLLYNFIVSYEPYNFKGFPSDYPLTVSYGERMNALRAELRSLLWDGAFLATRHGSVANADGQPHAPYSVFQDRTTGAYALVAANYDAAESVVLRVSCDDKAPVRYRLVDGDWQPYTGSVSLPAQSAAVFLFEA